MSKKEHICRK